MNPLLYLSMALHMAAYGFISTSMDLAYPEPSPAAALKSSRAASSSPSCEVVEVKDKYTIGQFFVTSTFLSRRRRIERKPRL
jgi:hypothetical protein